MGLHSIGAILGRGVKPGPGVPAPHPLPIPPPSLFCIGRMLISLGVHMPLLSVWQITHKGHEAIVSQCMWPCRQSHHHNHHLNQQNKKTRSMIRQKDHHVREHIPGQCKPKHAIEVAILGYLEWQILVQRKFGTSCQMPLQNLAPNS